MDTLKDYMLDRYTLILKHEYEFNKQDGQIERVKADKPLCISYAVAHINGRSVPIIIGDMMDNLKYELLKRLTAEE